ncbi:MAG: nuclear transport factor 2 family protein [Acidimicrobiales bacterium]
MGDRPTDDELQAVVDRAAIEDLQRAYADGVTRRDWAQVRSLFLPDAVVALDLVDRPGRELAGPEALTSFVAGAIERFSFFEFVILNARIALWSDGDRSAATATIFMCELRAEGEPPVRSEAFGRYQDAYRKVDGAWRIAGRRYRSIARFPDGIVHPLDGA